MTEEQKDILVAKMLDTPDSLSAEDLEIILKDDELRDIYEMSSCVNGACLRQPIINVEDEWMRFQKLTKRTHTSLWWVKRVAAIFIGVMFVSGITVRMIDHMFPPHIEQNIAVAESPTTIEPGTHLNDEGHIAAERLPSPSDPMLNPNASRPIYKKKTKTTKEIETPAEYSEEEDMEVDVDEFLRIQQARIDNELALQAAEAYREEFDNILPILNAAGVYNPEVDFSVAKVIMQ